MLKCFDLNGLQGILWLFLGDDLLQLDVQIWWFGDLDE